MKKNKDPSAALLRAHARFFLVSLFFFLEG